MRKLLLCILATGMVLVANSQNYRFFDNDYVLYRGGNSYYPYQTLNIDTIGSVYQYEFQTMLNLAVNPMHYNVNGPGFIGQFAEWDTTLNAYYLHNVFNDTITIFTNKPYDYTWLAYQKDTVSVMATISNIEYESYNDSLTDTIKTISFDCQGEYQNYSFDDEVFIISSRRGLMQVSNIIHFPNFFYTGSQTVFFKEEDSAIIQMFDPKTIDSISEAKIYDLNVDDELHTKEEYLDGPEMEWELYTVFKTLKVLDRLENENSNTLLYERKYKKWKNSEVVAQYWDTINASYSKIPIEGINRYDGSGAGCMIYSLGMQYERIELIEPNAYYYKINDSTWEQNHGDKSPGTSYDIVGLGGGYYYGAGVFYNDFRELVYYNVSGEEWGTPLDFTVGVNDIELESFKVYPNPVKDRLIINSPYLNSEAYLMVFDMSGKVVINERLKQTGLQTEIDMSDLSSGIYTIQIVNGKNIQSNKFIKID